MLGTSILKKSLNREGREDLRILVVDDIQDNRILMKTLLTGAGSRVALAESGESGIRQALYEHFDLILMDLQMPEMNGYQAVEKLRQLGYLKPIFALTAYASTEEMHKCLASGFDDFFTKPLKFSALLERIKQLV
jgi:CheY-like chemotaxis protein